MKLLENILIGIIVLFLSIHLFTVHSKLLFGINPDNLIDELTYNFNLGLFSQNYIVSTLSAIAYSLITALILTIFVKFNKVFLIAVTSFALLDGIGVFIYYNTIIEGNIYIICGAVYYALYTMFIIISLGWFRNLTYKDIELNKNIDNAVSESDVIQLRDKLNKEMNRNDSNVTKDMLDDRVYNLYFTDNLSQSKIASELDISQSKVSRILKKYNDESK